MDKEIKLAWLAGIIEGEGTYCVCKSSSRKHFTFSISITNADLLILNECERILLEHNIPSKLHKRKQYYAHRKQTYNLTINGIDNLINTIELMLPYTIGNKNAQASLMLKFLKRRKSLAENNKGRSARRIAYDDVDYAYLDAIKYLKSYSESVETITPSTLIKKCKVDGCESKYYAKGYCQKHYDKLVHYPRYSARLKGEDRVRADRQLSEVAEMTTRLN